MTHFQILHALVDLWSEFNRFSQSTVIVVEQNTARGPGCDDWCAIYRGEDVGTKPGTGYLRKVRCIPLDYD